LRQCFFQIEGCLGLSFERVTHLTYLFVVNDAPAASERAWNALRLAGSLAGSAGNTVRMFLLGDGVLTGVGGQTVPEGGHDVEAMLRDFISAGNEVAACRTCMDARQLTQADLVSGARVGTLIELAAWTALSDKVLVF
jgi:uncharacterized protein involved in oxidation of intracellular sulfur